MLVYQLMPLAVMIVGTLMYSSEIENSTIATFWIVFIVGLAFFLVIRMPFAGLLFTGFVAFCLIAKGRMAQYSSDW